MSEIGRHLIECKRIVGHGEWTSWLKREFSWSQDTAERFIRLAADPIKFRKLRNFDLPVSSIYLLTAPSTPAEVREKIIESVEKGEKVEHKAVVAAVKAAKKPATKAKVKRSRVSLQESRKEEAEERAEAKAKAEALLDEIGNTQPQPTADAAAGDDGGAKVRELERLNIALTSEVEELTVQVEELTVQVENLQEEIKVKASEIAKLRGKPPAPTPAPKQKPIEQAAKNPADDTSLMLPDNLLVENRRPAS
jgi:hypothetical protein